MLDSFRPGSPAGEGSNPYHWILVEASALLVADWKGIARGELRYTRDEGLRIAGSRNPTHHVEATTSSPATAASAIINLRHLRRAARRERSVSAAVSNTSVPGSVTVWSRETRGPAARYCHIAPSPPDESHHKASVSVFNHS